MTTSIQKSLARFVLACVAWLATVTPLAADAPPTRYTFPMPGIVYDMKTKLTWQQSIDAGDYTQSAAMDYCATSTLPGSGWRLPTRAELLTLVDPTKYDPAIDRTAFPNSPVGGDAYTSSVWFWTATASAETPGWAWYINFLAAARTSPTPKKPIAYAACAECAAHDELGRMSGPRRRTLDARHASVYTSSQMLRPRLFESPSSVFRELRRMLGYASCLSAVVLTSLAATSRAQMPVPAADSGAQNTSLPPVHALPDTLTQLSVVTFGRGAEVHQYFGHNAFVVSGPGLAAPLVVNYGMFSFGPDMIPQFLRGRLKFWVGTTELDATTAAYAAAKRDVRLLDLKLEPAALQVVLEQLKHDLQPENRSYLYDHYNDNCSTRLRDALDRALGGQLRRAWAQPSKYTLRTETLRYTQHDPLVAWSMMFGLSDRADRPLHVWDEAFLPEELERLLDTTSYQDSHGARVALVTGRRTLFDAHAKPLTDPPAGSWLLLLMLGTLIAIVALALADRVQPGQLGLYRICYVALTAAVGISAGVFGSLLVSLWAFSDHVVAHGNENLLLANPLSLIAGIASLALVATGRVAGWLRSLWGALAFSSLLLLLAHVVSPAFNQDIYWSAALLVPIYIGFALASQRVW